MSRRAYPVVEGARLLGMVDREAVQRMAANGAAQPIGRLLPPLSAEECASPIETCRAVAQRIAAAGCERMPVVEDLASLRLIGIVSRSDLLKPMRAQHEEESLRERNFRVRDSV